MGMFFSLASDRWCLAQSDLNDATIPNLLETASELTNDEPCALPRSRFAISHFSIVGQPSVQALDGNRYSPG